MLEVRNLYKSFDVAGKRQRVIEDLSFVVQDRDFYMILGQSGCGKSTLLRMLGGFAAPDKGDILLDGQRVIRPSRNMMMVFQEQISTGPGGIQRCASLRAVWCGP